MIWSIVLMVFILAGLMNNIAQAVRIKDIAKIGGVGTTHLVGYGLLVGLNGTGDSRQSLMANQTLRNMLKRFGITLPSQRLRIKNVAAVMVTAELIPFVQSGSQIDVVVSSMGDASSLQGGILLMTPLVDDEGDVYVKAQGAISVGGFDIKTIGGEQVRKNYTHVGRVPFGGTVERTKPFTIPMDTLRVNLHQPDFTTVIRIADIINQNFGSGIAIPVHAGQLLVAIPTTYQNPAGRIQFISQMEVLDIIPDQLARVVVNERTGTIVVGTNVSISEVAIAHGNLTIEISASPIISQPAPFSQGQTVAIQQTSTQVTTENSRLLLVKESVRIQDIAAALNELGVTPRDLIAIFQALKVAGALHAELVIM
ncbi:flagellar basal body P-ring protein FlgI [candidate division KSB1 bacterium]|nr:flagellar basal body P-ring protein FlgI [candidate division KSB1 bacterium]